MRGNDLCMDARTEFFPVRAVQPALALERGTAGAAAPQAARGRLVRVPARYVTNVTSRRWSPARLPRHMDGERSKVDERTTAMATIPNGDAEQKFQAMLANLLTPPTGWSEKQQLELEMARDISVEMLRLAESMRDTDPGLEALLTLLKYAKVVDFILTTLASRRDIRPQTLRVIFKLAGLKVIGRDDIRPAHPKAADPTDPLHRARVQEVTSLWRLGAK